VCPGAALISLEDNTAGKGKSDCDLVQHEATQTAVLAQHSKQEMFMHPATDQTTCPSPGGQLADTRVMKCHTVMGRSPFLASTPCPHAALPTSDTAASELRAPGLQS